MAALIYIKDVQHCLIFVGTQLCTTFNSGATSNLYSTAAAEALLRLANQVTSQCSMMPEIGQPNQSSPLIPPLVIFMLSSSSSSSFNSPHSLNCCLHLLGLCSAICSTYNTQATCHNGGRCTGSGEIWRLQSRMWNSPSSSAGTPGPTMMYIGASNRKQVLGRTRYQNRIMWL